MSEMGTTATKRSSAAIAGDPVTVNAYSFTRGPWHVYDGSQCDAIFKNHRTVCAYPDGDPKHGSMAVAYCDYHTRSIAEANARLIAAAPEMYAALAALVQCDENACGLNDDTGYEDQPVTSDSLRSALTRARAALRKASGLSEHQSSDAEPQKAVVHKSYPNFRNDGWQP